MEHRLLQGIHCEIIDINVLYTLYPLDQCIRQHTYMAGFITCFSLDQDLIDVGIIMYKARALLPLSDSSRLHSYNRKGKYFNCNAISRHYHCSLMQQRLPHTLTIRNCFHPSPSLVPIFMSPSLLPKKPRRIS